MHRSLLLWRLLVFVACRKCNDVYSPPRLVCIRLSAGSGREAGLLPRALVSLFRKLQGRLYGAMNLKPVMYHNVRELEPSEVRAEELRRNSLLKEVKKNKNKNYTSLKKKSQFKTVKNCYLQDENTSSRRPGGFTTVDSGIGGLSSISNIASQLNGKGDGGWGGAVG